MVCPESALDSLRVTLQVASSLVDGANVPVLKGMLDIAGMIIKQAQVRA